MTASTDRWYVFFLDLDDVGTKEDQDQQKPFMLIMRQWREVKRMKCFKRGHDARGVRATKQGELALKCCACPQLGWNLPDDWDKIDLFYR